MDKKTLIVKFTARNDLLSQFKYLVDQDQIKIAQKLMIAFEKALDKILLFPNIGSKIKFKNKLLEDMRSWPIPGLKKLAKCFPVSFLY